MKMKYCQPVPQKLQRLLDKHQKAVDRTAKRRFSVDELTQLTAFYDKEYSLWSSKKSEATKMDRIVKKIHKDRINRYLNAIREQSQIKLF